VIGTILAERTSEDWIEMLEAEGIPVARVNSLEDVLLDEHLAAVGMLKPVKHPLEGAITQVRPPVKFAAAPSEISRQAPGLGEHSTEILREAGLKNEEIESLLASGAASSGMVQADEIIAGPGRIRTPSRQYDQRRTTDDKRRIISISSRTINDGR